GFPPDDVAVLVALVRHHLLLADLATRRDVEDPVTAAAVATALRDPVTVELLAALTEADSLATGPAAWSPWKAGLVSDLADHAVAVLTGGPRDAGLALEEFHVQAVFGTMPEWADVEADLRRVLEGRLSLETEVADRARRYDGRPRPPGSVSAVPARTSVIVDNRASATATVVEVRAPDRIGTLYRITQALADPH